MANVFIYTPDGSIVPTLANRKAENLISELAELYERPLPASVEDVESSIEARRAELFTQVATGEVKSEDAASLLKQIDKEAAESRRIANEEPKLMLMNGVPSSLSEIKRAFRKADSGTFVRVEALESDNTSEDTPEVKNSGTITMFRL